MAYKNKEDQANSSRKYYLANKELHKQRVRENNERYKKRNREFVRRYKLFVKCRVCGFDKHESALEFHHLSPKDKDGDVARLIQNSISLTKIKTEIRKCVVLCANCHRCVHAGVLRLLL